MRHLEGAKPVKGDGLTVMGFGIPAMLIRRLSSASQGYSSYRSKAYSSTLTCWVGSLIPNFGSPHTELRHPGRPPNF